MENTQMTGKIADEFAAVPMNEIQAQNANEIRGAFDQLLATVSIYMPPENGRYLALTKTKLEEACFFAIKGSLKR